MNVNLRAVIATLWLLCGGSSQAQQVDLNKSYGRIAFFAVKGDKEQPLTAPIRFEPGQKLVGMADANVHCVLLVVGFSKDKQFLSTFAPYLGELDGADEVKISDQQRWIYDESLRQGEIIAAFFPPNHPKLPLLRNLVNGLRVTSPQTAALRVAQAVKLRALVAELGWREASPQDFPESKPPSIGGVFRGPYDDWRPMSRSVNFTTVRPGFLSFTITTAAPKSN